jgi:N-acetylated-alpha-linked acidic dipeptidase
MASGVRAQEKAGIRGFTDPAAAEQLALEAAFDAGLQAANLDKWMKHLSARPHHVGSEWGKQNAEYIAGLFRSWGYAVEIETYHVLFPTPKLRLLEMVAPKKFTATLEEPALAVDTTSGQKDEQLPSFNAYAADGDVTAEVVFVNQGIPQDYEDLERLGIDVKGKLLLARYGGSWRGIKPKVAQEHGALGVILYSDPEDDGYFQGEVYPEGPYRRAEGVQRGAVMDLPMRPGDPLTPFKGATETAERLPLEKAETILKIPVLPISYADALPILEALGGPVAPERWRGALPLTYHVGPGPAVVHLKLEFNWDIKPAYNVIARLEGAELPDQWVMRGNHHDAWVNGAADPISGMVALLEEARMVGALAKAGKRPRRSVLYAAWDAEEPGLIGSTEWVEDHAGELRQKLVAYINTDAYARGFLAAGGSHSLEAMFAEIAEAVPDPLTGIALAARERAWRLLKGSKQQKKEAEDSALYRLRALGSGSDYSPFLQHLGIAAFNLSFLEEAAGGSYHSIYDSYDHYTRFMDPGFIYGVALSKVAGRVTLRLANADLLPFEFAGFARTLGVYMEQIEKLAEETREATEKHNKNVEGGVFAAFADPTKPFVEVAPKDTVPAFDFTALKSAIEKVHEAADKYGDTYMRFAAGGFDTPPEARAAIDQMLYLSERALTEASGLPRRPWFRHHIYAPGFYTGYGVKTLPGVREAIEKRYWSETELQITKLAALLERFAAYITEASVRLGTLPARSG